MRRVVAFMCILILAAAVVPAALQPGHAVAASSLRISRGSVAPGDLITVQGFGFAPQDDVVVALDLRVSNHAQEVQAVTQADPNGAFVTTLVVPNGANQGTYPITARDFHGNLATKNVSVLPLAYLAVGGKVYTVWVIPGHTFYVKGAGFKAGESIQLSASFPQYDGNAVVVNRTVGADSQGNFGEVQLRVPRNVKAGNVTLQAAGQSSGRKAKNTLHVFYQPTITPPTQTVRPGQAAQVSGHEFVPGSTVHVSLTIPRNGGTTETLTRDVTAGDNGDFSTSIVLPSNVSLGKYSLTARDNVGGFHASSSVVVSVHPSIKLDPTSILPGQAFTASGDNFGSGSFVTVSASFPVSGGAHKTVSANTQTGNRGEYTVKLAAPSNATPGQVTVTAHASNGQVSAKLQVKPRPPLPTATPVPTATQVPATSTSVPVTVPPTSTPTPPHHHGFGYRYVSIWWHTVRVGTHEHFVVQATLKTTQGLWIHVYFPSGQQVAIYKNTNSKGHFETDVNIPPNAIAGSNTKVVVTFRLWHGKKSRRFFASFTLVR